MHLEPTSTIQSHLAPVYEEVREAFYRGTRNYRFEHDFVNEMLKGAEGDTTVSSTALGSDLKNSEIGFQLARAHTSVVVNSLMEKFASAIVHDRSNAAQDLFTLATHVGVLIQLETVGKFETVERFAQPTAEILECSRVALKDFIKKLKESLGETSQEAFKGYKTFIEDAVESCFRIEGKVPGVEILSAMRAKLAELFFDKK